ncbi:hypothetical protein Syun_031583 [Stephania yunnanensis]|uniref:Uncharacterized protein n=1 Tax=Stephania yunnanensis TaxID=152371 RepID=A0AAP0DZM3_9MAGN
MKTEINFDDFIGDGDRVRMNELGLRASDLSNGRESTKHWMRSTRVRREGAAPAARRLRRRRRGRSSSGVSEVCRHAARDRGWRGGASAGLRRRDIDSGGVNGVEQLRGGALSDRSFIDEGCDSTRFDDARDSNEDSLCVLYNWLLDMTKTRLVDCVLTNTDEDLQSFDHDETQPPSEDQRNDNETQDELSSNEASFRRERLYVNKLNLILVQAKLQRRRQEMTQTTPDQPMDDEAVYCKVAGDYPKGCVYSLRSLWRKKRRYVDPDASTSQVQHDRFETSKLSNVKID